MLHDQPGWITAKSSVGETVLHYLVIENDIETVKFLIDKGADVNTCTNSGTTPLMHAARLGYLEMCLLLMEKGADVNVKDQLLDYTAMHYAADSGKVEILDALLTAGGRANTHGEYERSVAEVTLLRKRALLLGILNKHGYS